MELSLMECHPVLEIRSPVRLRDLTARQERCCRRETLYTGTRAMTSKAALKVQTVRPKSAMETDGIFLSTMGVHHKAFAADQIPNTTWAAGGGCASVS